MAKEERPIIIAGNWKMHKTAQEAKQYIQELMPMVAAAKNRVCLAVPFTCLSLAAKLVAGTPVAIGAQNIHSEIEGPFTGEISAGMVKDAGADFVIVGHSERRVIFKEDNGFINKKVKQAFNSNLQPFLCIGETEQEREQGLTEDILKDQVLGCLEGISESQAQNLVIAYEPVWAIGTGKTATPGQAQDMHKFCRNLLSKRFGEAVAFRIPVLYGGSVKPDNICSLMDQSDIDGALVGGASLKAEVFSQLINYQTIMSP